MGASTSRIDEDKALQLCRERKKFVQQALDGRCLLAATHVSYVQSLKSTGTALRKFAETEVPVESSLFTSTSATPEQPLALIEKSTSHLSYSPPPPSHSHHDTYSPPPSPPSTSPFQVNHMKFRGFSSKKVEEKPPVSIVATVTSSSSIPPSRSMEKIESNPSEESSSMPPETPPWDYFDPSHPIDRQFSSSHIGNGHVSRSVKGEDETTEVEDDGQNFSFREREESSDSDDDEFDEPTSDTLVRSFENFNRVRRDHNALPQREGVESEFSDTEKSKTPELSPPVTPLVATPVNRTPNKGDHTENKLPPRDILSSMKEIELLFVKASETGKEVPRMLEANKLHFRPIVPSKESGAGASSLFKTCLSCGEDPKDVPEEPAQNSTNYLTWHRTESSRSASSQNPLEGLNSDDVEELNSNLFENICMIAGSHASTLDRLYAWERKLYDEVKGSQTVRREYDEKCRILRELESEGKGSQRIDKTRAVVKDLHSRIRVAIHRIDSISRRIEELRDKELQPQLEELIEGLSRMWEVMLECHKVQFQLIKACYRGGNIKLNMQSELHRQVTSNLEDELSAMASSFTKWITGQKSYIQAINEWLVKCVALPQRSVKRKRRAPQPSLRDFGPPPIYATCGIWLEKLEVLPTKEVSSSIKALASDVARFLPRQEKNRTKKHRSGENMLQEETLEDCGPGFDRFRTSLEGFAGQLNQFAESSVTMYEELKQGIHDAKDKYEQLKAYSQGN
ncbi:Protein ALTERED PHOSPHATE STARVATION RESPONSE 1 [Cardamine amara subsp. amara]|uniref:Protein ALTERED PHOSPHATE STARVATION RESPONSE 1 n=1 Tax=Cardamine amara subsp. amara TaxID=228776 RepID=A0ABD1C8T0_CARAN